MTTNLVEAYSGYVEAQVTISNCPSVSFSNNDNDDDNCSIAKPKFAALPKDMIGRIGICKQEHLDYSYQNINIYHFDDIYAMRMSCPYRVYAPDRREIIDQIGENGYKEIKHDLQEVASKANKKRKELISLLLTDPYLPYSKKINGIFMMTVVDGLLKHIDRGYWILYPVVGLAILCLIPVWAFMIVIDVIMCKWRRIPCQKEIEWILAVFKSHRELNTSRIDLEIQKELELVCTRISLTYGKAAKLWSGVETSCGESGSHIVHLDEFMIYISCDTFLDVEVQVSVDSNVDAPIDTALSQ